MASLGATELILILLVVLLLFGAKRLPDLSRSVGRSLRILKSETKALHGDDDDRPAPPQQQAAIQSPVVSPTAPAAEPGPAPETAPVPEGRESR